MIFSIPSNYFLSSYALTLTLNAMSLPDYMQASAASGARIMVYMKVDKIDNPNSDATITAENALIDTLNIDLGYDVDLNYRAWTINLVPTYFTNTAEKYIYAAIPRGSSNATTAMIVFPSNKIDVFGRMEQTMIINNQEVTKVVQVGSADYYYIWLYGEISPSVDGTGASQNRVFITDVQNNLLSPYNSGALDTKKSQTEGLVDDLSERFLSKIKDDSTPYNLNIGKDLKVGGNSTVDGNSTVSKDSIVNGNQTVGGNESVSGYATIGGDVTIGGKSTITGDNSVGGNSIITGDNTVGGKQVIKGELSSSNFNSDNQEGFAIKKKDSNHYKISITDIEIWGKAIFNVLEVRKLISIGGNFMFSPSSGKILLVQNFSTFYRCYLLADDGTTATTNNFKVGDNVLCETFNIAEGVYSNVSNKRYWRTIVDVSTVSEIIYDKGMIYWNQIDDDHIVYDENNNPVTYISKEPIVQNKKFYWIDLSKTLCEEGSDIPEAGDEIATFGNINDITRQNSIYIVCEGESSPAIKFYKGVNSFDLTNKKPILISPDRFEVLSDIFTLRTSNGRTISIANYKGVWTEGTVAYYGEQYSYDGRIWECVNKTYGITTAPFLGEDWNIVVDKGEKGDTGNDGIAGKDGVGISSTTITYQIGDSGTTAPTGTWSSTVPTAIPGKYLWTRTVWTYTDSTNETGYSVSKYGEKGDTGSSVYLLDLTNENSSVTCDKSGNVIGILQDTTAHLYYGSSIVSGVVYSAVFTGCSGSINANTGVVTMSGLSSNTGTVTIIATHSSGYLTAIYTITKVYAGADGSNAVTYYIMPSVSSIQKDNDTLTPSTITCSKYKQIGGQTPVVTSEKTLKYKQSSDTSETTYSGSITISSSATYIDFILYDTDGTTILDKERIPVIQNGISVSTVDVEYAQNQSSTNAPTSGWQTTAPTWQNGYYIWTRTTIQLSDGSESTTESVCISGGKGIQSIVEYYYKSTSSSSLIGGTWQTTAPAWENGYYIWTKSIITFTDNSTSETTPINATGNTGNDGINGTGAWNIVMSCSSIIFTQALDKSINISGNKSYFSLFYQGVLDTIDHVEIITQNNCSASILQDTSGYYLQINSISLDTNNNYYTNGYVVINIGKNGIHTENVRFNWALNALGTFKEQIINDTDTRYASKTEFDTLSNNVVTETELSSAIEQSASEIELSVTVNTKILDFGGINANLIRGSKLFDIDTSYLGTLNRNVLNDFTGVYNIFSNNTIDVLQWYDKINIKKNTYYTLSMYIKGTGNISTFLYPDCCSKVINSDGFSGSGSDGYNVFNYDTSEYKKVWVTWLTNDTTTGYKSLLAARLNSGNIFVCGVKLEEGSIPTKWVSYQEVESDNYIDNPNSPTLCSGTMSIVNDSDKGNVINILNNTGQNFQLLYKSDNIDNINVSDYDVTFFAIIKDINGSSNWGFGGWFNWDNFYTINNGVRNISNIYKIKYVAKANSQTIISIYNSTDKTYTVLTTMTNSSSDEGVIKSYTLSNPISLAYNEYIAIKGGVKIGNYDSENILVSNRICKKMAMAISIYGNNDSVLYSSIAISSQDYGTYDFLTNNSPYDELGGGWRRYYNSFISQGNIWDKTSGLGLNSLNGELRIYSVGIVRGDSSPNWLVNTIDQKLLSTGVNIKDGIISTTANTFFIVDNSGNINTVFETVNGFPMVRSKIIQADKIVATKIKTSDFGTRTEVINDMISQYNDLGELAVRIHGGSLNTSSGEVAIGSIAPRVIDRTINASNGLIQEFDISLTANDTFEVTSLMNTIKVYDSDSIVNVPIDCAITCNNVKSIGYELYVSDIAGDNMSGAYIFSENPSTGTLNLTKGMSGTVVLTSSIARTGCKIYVHFIIEFNNSSGSLVIRNTNLEDGNESIFNVKIKYGGNVTEIAKDGFLTSFGNYGFKISSSGIQKSVDGGTTWNPI